MKEYEMVKVEWVDSTVITSSQTKEEHEICAKQFDDMEQVSVGIITYECSTHICLASMIAKEGNVGLAIKIPRSVILSCEKLQVSSREAAMTPILTTTNGTENILEY